MQVHHLQKIARRGLCLEPHFPFAFVFTSRIFLSFVSPFLSDHSCDITFITCRNFSWDDILQLCDHFIAVRVILVLSVLAVTFLNFVSMFLAVAILLVLFSLRKINTLVDVCTTLVERSLELRFNTEGSFIFSWGCFFWSCYHLVIFIWELFMNPLDGYKIDVVIKFVFIFNSIIVLLR